METDIQWIRLESEPVFNAEGLGEAEVKGKRICLVRKAAALYACVARCPHAGGHMIDGYVDGSDNIVCPVHRYKFSLKTGRNTSGEGYFLQVYPVERRPDGLYVGIERRKWFQW